MKRQKIAPIFTKSAKKAKSESSQDESADENAPPREWKIICWNVAGARAWVKKNGHNLLKSHDADIVFLGETKCPELPGELKVALGDDLYSTMAVSTAKKGYAGVALISKQKPIKVWKGIGDDQFDDEGRLIIAEYPRFYFVGAYVPNSGRGLVNLAKRAIWEEKMRAKLKELDASKPVIYGGDLNVSHEEIDLANPKANANKVAGFTDQERGDMTKMLDECGLVDTFRKIHGDRVAYTFWSYLSGARSRNIGWRLDYFLTSTRIAGEVSVSDVLEDPATTSDHAPIVCKFNI